MTSPHTSSPNVSTSLWFIMIPCSPLDAYHNVIVVLPLFLDYLEACLFSLISVFCRSVGLHLCPFSFQLTTCLYGETWEED
jgi:hypothetical protein